MATVFTEHSRHPTLPNPVPFTYASPIPLTITGLNAGDVIDAVEVVITTPFDDPAATVRVGTSAAPSLVIPPVPATIALSFASDEAHQVAVPEFLYLTISPGASVQGAGYVLFTLR